MVLEIQTQVIIDVGKFRGVQVPGSPGELHGAQERQLWHFEPGARAAGVQDREVEARVVRGEEIGAGEKRL